MDRQDAYRQQGIPRSDNRGCIVLSLLPRVEGFQSNLIMEIIVTTQEDLRAIIAEEVREALNIALSRGCEFPAELTTEQAAAFLSSRADPSTPGKIRSLVFRKSIPFHKRGQRLFFSRDELSEWLDSREERGRRAEAGYSIARSARRKG